MARQRDYAREYARRIERGLAKGDTRATARGHGAARRPSTSSNPNFVHREGKLESALKSIKRGMTLKGAAAEQHVAPERLRRYLAAQTTVTRQGGRLLVVDNRARQFPVYSEGELKAPVLSPPEATKASHYLRAVDKSLNTGRTSPLEKHRGSGVTDVKGKFLPFETDINALYRLDTAGELYFPEIYKITSGEANNG